MTDNTSLNQSHWGEAASTYDSKHQKTINQIITEIQARKDWIGVDWISDDSSSEEEASSSSANTPKKTVRLLDYACGTGLVSRALLPSISSTTGIDLTPAMVSIFNTTAQNQGLSESEMHAYEGNLLSPSDPSPSTFQGKEFWDFDIAVVGLGFHHFDDPGLAARRLAERVKRGGVLMIVDFLPHGHFHGHDAAKTVTHMGFSEEEVKKIFEEAGVGGDFKYVHVGKGSITFGEGKEKMERSVFFARGTRL